MHPDEIFEAARGNRRASIHTRILYFGSIPPNGRGVSRILARLLGDADHMSVFSIL